MVAYEFDFEFAGFDCYVERDDRDRIALASVRAYEDRDLLRIDDDDAGAEEVRSAVIDLD